MMSNLRAISIENTVIKVREPEKITGNTPVILLLHGYSGDESSMWVFGSRIPKDALVIALRAPYPSPDVGLGGYTWVNQPIQHWPVYQDMFPAAAFIGDQLSALAADYPDANMERLTIVGFSQGGAAGVVFANIFPGQIDKIALLSSFLPDGSEGFLSRDRFSSIKMFIAHGKTDKMVSVDLAHQAVKTMSPLCADLIFCTTDVGHQLGADCFKAFGEFLA